MNGLDDSQPYPEDIRIAALKLAVKFTVGSARALDSEYVIRKAQEFEKYIATGNG